MPNKAKDFYRNYPKPVARRAGCKVGWYYYRTLANAETAAKFAEEEANLMCDRGYDFGFIAPGTIRHVEQGEYAGLYEVVVP